MRIRNFLAAATMLTLAATVASTAGFAASAPPSEAGLPGFLAVNEVIVPIAVRGRLNGYVVIKAAIEFENPDVAKSAEPWLPRIVDAWLRTVHGLSQRGHFDQALVDPDMLKRQLLLSTKGAITSAAPSDVLISQAIFTKVN